MLVMEYTNPHENGFGSGGDDVRDIFCNTYISLSMSLKSETDFFSFNSLYEYSKGLKPAYISLNNLQI